MVPLNYRLLLVIETVLKSTYNNFKIWNRHRTNMYVISRLYKYSQWQYTYDIWLFCNLRTQHDIGILSEHIYLAGVGCIALCSLFRSFRNSKITSQAWLW